MKKALYVKYFLRDVIVLNNLDRFITLTLKPSKIPNEFKNDTHKYITKLFNHLITTLKRKKIKYFNKRKNRWFSFELNHSALKLMYVWVAEFQKNGNAHLHILFNQFLPVEVIREVWEHIGGGHSIFATPVRTIEGISNYITDYIIKGIKGNKNKPSGFKFFQRRYSISRSCIRPPKKVTIDLMQANSNLERKYNLTSLDLLWVYNTLHSFDYKEKVIKFLTPK
jgi:hypothetical protein